MEALFNFHLQGRPRPTTNDRAYAVGLSPFGVTCTSFRPLMLASLQHFRAKNTQFPEWFKTKSRNRRSHWRILLCVQSALPLWSHHLIHSFVLLKEGTVLFTIPRAILLSTRVSVLPSFWQRRLDSPQQKLEWLDFMRDIRRTLKRSQRLAWLSTRSPPISTPSFISPKENQPC